MLWWKAPTAWRTCRLCDLRRRAIAGRPVRDHDGRCCPTPARGSDLSPRRHRRQWHTRPYRRRLVRNAGYLLFLGGRDVDCKEAQDFDNDGNHRRGSYLQFPLSGQPVAGSSRTHHGTLWPPIRTHPAHRRISVAVPTQVADVSRPPRPCIRCGVLVTLSGSGTGLVPHRTT